MVSEFGAMNAQEKVQNFLDLGNAPYSVIAFHNAFLPQIRNAFVVGAYYPALTGACALGERILNHLVLRLRDYYKATPEYRKVRGKKSFDKWDIAIDALEAWNVLHPEVAIAFRKLKEIRNQKAIHFNPEIDRDERTPALEAIRTLTEIIGKQFSAFFGPLPWFIQGTPGECFIKKECEDIPFIKEIYLASCFYVGPYFTITSALTPQGVQLTIHDEYPYETKEITDDEFVRLRLEAREHQNQ